MPVPFEMSVADAEGSETTDVGRPTVIQLDGKGATPRELEVATQLMRLLDALIEAQDDDEALAERLFEQALLYLGPLADPDKALDAARRAYHLRPSAAHIARLYRRAAVQCRAWADDSKAIEAEAKASERPAHKAALLAERGRILHQVREKPEAARRAYLDAVKAWPEHVESLTGLERIASEQRDFEDAARWAAELGNATVDSRLKAEHLARAAQHLVGAGLDELALERLREAEEHHGSSSVHLLLEQVYCRTDAIEELVTLRLRQIEEAQAPEDLGWFDVGVLRRYRLGDRAGAGEAFEKAAASPNVAVKRAALEELAGLAEADRAFARLVELEEARLGLIEDASERAALCSRIGNIYLDKLKDEERAVAAFEQALRADPCHGPTLEAAGRLFHRRGDLVRLVDMHRAQAERTPDLKARADALCRLGILLVGSDLTIDEGIEILKEGLSLRPNNMAAFTALQRALLDGHRCPELLEVYEEQLEQTESPLRRAALFLKLGTVLQEELGDFAGAAEAFESALDQGAERSPPEALMRLVQVAEEGEDYSTLARALERLLQYADRADELASVLERLGDVYERLGMHDEALRVYRRAIEDAPTDHPVQVAAGWAFIRAERYEDLVALFDASARRAQPEARAKWLLKKATVIARYLEEDERALACVDEALRESPEDVLLRRLRLELLHRSDAKAELYDELSELDHPGVALRCAALAESLGRHDEARVWYRRALDRGADAAVLPLLRAALRTNGWADVAVSCGRLPGGDARYRAGVAAMKLGDTATAREHFAFASKRTDSPHAALSALLPLLGEVPRSKVAVLERLEFSIEDPAARSVYRNERLQLLDSLGERDLLLRARWAAFEARAGDPVGDLALEQLLREEGQRRRLLEVYTARAGEEQLDPDLRRLARIDAARILEELGMSIEAMDAWEDVIERSGRLSSIVGLVSLLRLHRRAADADAVLRVQKRLASVLPAGPLRTRCFRELGVEFLARGEADKAAESFEAALRSSPLDLVALRQLEQALVAAGRDVWAGTVDPLFRAFESESRPVQAATLGTRLGIALLYVGRVDAARQVIDRVRALSPRDPSATMVHAEICEREKQWKSAVAAYDQIAAEPDAKPWAAFLALRKAISLCNGALDDEAGARQRVARWNSDRFDECDPLGERADVLEALGELGPACDLLARLAGRVELPPDQRRGLTLRHADLLEAQSRDDEAITVVVECPDLQIDAEIARRLLSWATASGRWDLALQPLETALDARVCDEAFELLARVKLAELRAAEPDAHAQARAHYRRIVELAPDRLEAWERLAALDPMGGSDRGVVLRRLVELEPHNLDRYAALRAALLEQRDEDGAFCVEAVLEGLGAATEETSYFYRQRRALLRPPTFARLDDAGLRGLCPELKDPEQVLAARLEPLLDAVVPPDLTAYGVSGHDDIPSPLLSVARSIAASFGIDDFTLKLIPGDLGPTVESFGGLQVFVPRGLLDAPPREQQFVFGALFCRVAIGALHTDPRRANALGPTVMQYVFDALLELVAGRAPQGPSSPIYNDLRGRLERSLHGFDADLLRQAVADLPSGKEPQAKRVIARAHRASLRAGLVFAHDPAVAITGLSKYGKMFGRANAAATADPLTRDALAFAVSAEHAALRRGFGLGILS